jgi:hypothetical protein
MVAAGTVVYGINGMKAFLTIQGGLQVIDNVPLSIINEVGHYAN